MEVKDIHLPDEVIQLDQFLKFGGVLPSGGAVKPLIEEGRVRRNGEKETARRRKIHPGDVIEIEDIGAYRFVRDPS